jgi:hypothetical protein
MTEAEWLGCTDPTLMLQFLQNKASDRKLRLFACRCAEQSAFRSDTIPVVERFVDQQATAEELSGLVSAWDYRGHEESGWYRLYLPTPFTATAAAEIARDTAADAGAKETTYNAFSAARDAMRKVQCCLLRDIFGNPFRSVTFNSAWLAWNDCTVRKITPAIYDERAFDRMPILADALEDAGCDNADILTHCRSEGPHVRGCWVVDLLLGKE